MKIAVFAMNSNDGYSGGRMHALLMVEALAEAGHRLTYITNTKPRFYSEYEIYTAHSSICLHIDTAFKHSHSADYDVVVVVPHAGGNWSQYTMYLEAERLARRSNARLVLLNFESESWFNSTSSKKKPAFLWKNWKRVANHCDMVLSIAAEAMPYARTDYSSFYHSPTFAYCHPGINTRCIDSLPTQKKDPVVIVFARWADPHKNSNAICELIGPALENYTLQIVVGSGDLPYETEQRLYARGKRYGVEIQIDSQLSEREKYSSIARARALVMISSFEGFGLPPVEAQYCGTPSVAFDLPVLREVNKSGITYVPQNDYKALKKALHGILKAAPDGTALREGIRDIATFESYSHRISSAMTLALEGPRRTGLIQSIIFIRDFVCTNLSQSFCASLMRHTAKAPYHLARDFVRAYIRTKWELLEHTIPCSSRPRVAIFGAGAHTHWLETVLAQTAGPEIVAVLDDRPDAAEAVWEQKPISPAKWDPSLADAIVLSSDSCADKLRHRCEKLFGKAIATIDLYEGLPRGPYTK